MAVALRVLSWGAVDADSPLPTGRAEDRPLNVLFVVADDLGVDNVGVYGEHPDPARTPNIDQLATDGLLFRRAYANPVCSPSRATLLTGRYAWRNGLGMALSPWSSDRLPITEKTLATLLAPTHRTAAVGKWHLGVDPAHPAQMGFDHHRGTLNNISSFMGGTYDDYEKNVDGVAVRSTTYATTDTVDDALALIQQFGSDPWFLWVAFNAAHTPLHKPPAALHGYTLPAAVEGNEPIHSKAMIEALDTELGRLLASLDPLTRANTLIVFISDNGPVSETVTAPWDPDKAKTTVFELGVRVPLVIAGPGVPAGLECEGLVNTTDLFATVLEAVGVPHPAPEDAVSLAPYFVDPTQPSLREHVYVESFSPNAGDVFDARRIAVRGERFKLIQRFLPGESGAPREEFYDLLNDPYETVDLIEVPPTPEVSQAYLELRAVLAAQGPPAVDVPWATLGGGTQGALGPLTLSGNGLLQPGTPAGIELRNAQPHALCLATIALSPVPILLNGGGFSATPATVHQLFLADAQGTFAPQGPWPPGFPSGTGLWIQCLASDPSVFWGVTLSNAIKATTP